MAAIEMGRLLSSSTSSCVVGCRVSQASAPSFGSLVFIPIGQNTRIFGLIYDIRIEDDGLVRQLVTAERVTQEVLDDNKINRSVPVEFSVLHVGYEQVNKISHLLPPRPPLSLDAIYPAEMDDVVHFTSHGRFGYFRHILRAADLPVGELLAAHVRQAGSCHHENGNDAWRAQAVQELITLLRDDYAALNSVLGALTDAVENW